MKEGLGCVGVLLLYLTGSDKRLALAHLLRGGRAADKKP